MQSARTATYIMRCAARRLLGDHAEHNAQAARGNCLMFPHTHAWRMRMAQSSHGVSRSASMKASGCTCACACAWAPAIGMIHVGRAVPWSCQRACHICLRSGKGSDGNVYNALRGLGSFGDQARHNAQPLDSGRIVCRRCSGSSFMASPAGCTAPSHVSAMHEAPGRLNLWPESSLARDKVKT